MIPVFVDFETYWSTTHNIGKLGPYEYVMHPETELICVSIKEGDAPTEVVFGEAAIRKRLAKVDWSKAIAIAHNMHGFDGLILAWRLGIHPKLWGCTLAMARSRYAKVSRLGLGAICDYLKIGTKNDKVLHTTKGKHLAEFTPQEREDMAVYCVSDTDNGAGLYHHMRQYLSAREMLLIDMTIRMVTEPMFDVDVPLLERTLADERARKHELLLSLTSDEDKLFSTDEELAEKVKSTLASAAKFKTFLERCEIEVPMKKSPSDPNKLIPALAKTDDGFIALMEHPDPLISLAARARMDVKSTLLETRIEKLLSAVAVCPGAKLPIPLKYYGAHTGRWSGEQYNPQNLPRVDKDRPKASDALRYALKAPPGYAVMVADQSGIELRVNHHLWRVPSSMSLYRADPKADLYVAFAAQQYGISPEQVDKLKRQLAKVAQLGLGFGAGAPTFRKVAKLMSGGKLDLTEQEAYEVVSGWRNAYPEIVKGWYACGNALDFIIAGREIYIDPGELVYTTKEGMVLPSGRVIHYPQLRRLNDGERTYTYGLGQHATYVYGGKVVENIVQALARDCLSDVALSFFLKWGYRPSLMVHDELVYLVPEDDAQDMLDDLQSIMRTPPKWWPDLVVWSEGSVGLTYGAAK